MYIHSYSFNPNIFLYIHSAECTVRLLNQAGGNYNYPYNPNFAGNTGNRTREVSECIQTSSSTLNLSATLLRRSLLTEETFTLPPK